MPGFRVRDAGQDDEDFLAHMLIEAVNWRPGAGTDRDDVIDRPHFAHYVAAWMRPDDLGVVAVDGDGNRLGAAWLRHLTAQDPGYGYVSDDVPELTIGVLQDRRGQGIGTSLLDTLIVRARARGLPAVSLSVERANPAQRLYVARGFTSVTSFTDADTMLLPLGGRQ